jgi:hypothetical protein
MDNGSVSGQFGMSSADKAELVTDLARIMGVNEKVSQTALEAADFELDSAIELITYGQQNLPEDVQMDCHANAQLELAACVASVTSCDLASAKEALLQCNNDVDEAINMILWHGNTALFAPPHGMDCG